MAPASSAACCSYPVARVLRMVDHVASWRILSCRSSRWKWNWLDSGVADAVQQTDTDTDLRLRQYRLSAVAVAVAVAVCDAFGSPRSRMFSISATCSASAPFYASWAFRWAASVDIDSLADVPPLQLVRVVAGDHPSWFLPLHHVHPDHRLPRRGILRNVCTTSHSPS